MMAARAMAALSIWPTTVWYLVVFFCAFSVSFSHIHFDGGQISPHLQAARFQRETSVVISQDDFESILGQQLVNGRLGFPVSRRKRAVSVLTIPEQTVAENQTGTLLNFNSYLNKTLTNFQLSSSSVDPEMFVLSPQGVLRLKEGRALDFENANLRSIRLLVHAVSSSNATDEYNISATLAVTNVNEPPVFTTSPEPYLATVLTSSVASQTIFTVVASDPDGSRVYYSMSVNPSNYTKYISAPTSDQQYQLRLAQSLGPELSEGMSFNVIVTARDAESGGLASTATVNVLVGRRAPQFYQSRYEGSILEENQPQQTIYKYGTTDELLIRWKVFQDGEVSLSLKNEQGGITNLFSINNDGSILCQETFDYEVINPKSQSLTVTATQRVGNTDLSSSVPVIVHIEDKNDNKPVFDQSQYQKEVPENHQVGQEVLTVTATDGDTGVNAQIDYSVNGTEDFEIVTQNNSGIFVGVIKVKRPLDFDRPEGPNYNFQVIAADRGIPSLMSTSSVRVTVTNVNDEHPQFVISPGNDVFEVMENAPVDQIITQIQATDKDVGDRVSYSITGGAMNKFEINAVTGLLRLKSPIGAQDDRFTLEIKAEDDGQCCGGTITLSNTTTIYVQVTGVNNEKPNFRDCANYRPSVEENSPVGTSVHTVSATDNDRGPNGVVTYSITQFGTSFFNINSSTGLITVAANIDREATGFLQVTVTGADGGKPSLEGWCAFTITVNDTNDNTPIFQTGDPNRDMYVANISRTLQPGVSFVTVRATDQDVGNNARITYSLIDDANGKFEIIPENGFISLNSTLDGPDTQYILTAMAKDGGNPSLNSTIRVQVNVKADSSNPPQWAGNYSTVYKVNETAEDGTPIIENMRCNSGMNGTRVEFQLIGENGATGTRTEFFAIQSPPTDPNSVTVYATGKFDYLTKTEHQVRIRCLNLGLVALPNEINPLVSLIDTNNQLPTFQGSFGQDGRYSASVQENKEVGFFVITIVATDLDATFPYNQITFEITEGGENFELRPGNSNNTADIYTRIIFDREKQDNYILRVTAKDGAPSVLPSMKPGPNIATVVVQIAITDINDNPPYFDQPLYNITVREDYYVDQAIIPAISVQDADESDRGRHTFSVAQQNGVQAFGILPNLGNLYLVRRLDYETGDKYFSLEVKASDGLHTASTSVVVTVEDVNDNNPKFSQDVYEISNITEHDENVPKLLFRLNATDADEDRENNIRYSLQGTSFAVDEFFRIDAQTGDLFVIKALDREPPGRERFLFTVVAEDEPGNNPRLGFASVSVRPIDVNDNAPRFTGPMEAAVPENSVKGYTVMGIQAFDPDAGDNAVVVYAIENIVNKTGSARPDYFTIDDKGLIKTNVDANLLDRETEDGYLLTVVLSDKGNPPLETTGTVTIMVSDINDQPPIFQQKIYNVDISENLEINGLVTIVTATDGDIGENAIITYTLQAESDRRFFKIDSNNNEGNIRLFQRVDYENAYQRSFNLTVQAQDVGRLSDICYVHIQVLDFNDEIPDVTPKTLSVEVLESAPVDTLLANFSATDRDSGINGMFDFSISRQSDRERQFKIHPTTGLVAINKPLDRETVPRYALIIQAIDKGSPSNTGTAILNVVVTDVNDNYPTFKENYQPHVPEEEDNINVRIVQEIFAKDPDAPPFGPPFGFQLTSCTETNCQCSGGTTCEQQFQLQWNRNGDGGNGTATISTQKRFDREKQKYYLIPIIMWDMEGSASSQAQTGTNTLTVTIADINDNDMKPGHQDIFVYNYKDMFGPVDVGRVYVEDLDDWDLPDKTFTFTGPDWMGKYFIVNEETGMITMQKGVPSNTPDSPYVFTVRVHDRKFDSTVTSSVSVVVETLTEEAVRNSGAVRLSGTSAEMFIKRSATTSGSQRDIFQKLLADKLETDVQNVQIINIQDVEGGLTDVRYSVHGSPYYPPTQSDSLVLLAQAEFESKLGNVQIVEVPIDACLEEEFEGGCYNFMDITGKPAMVNANGTSFVSVEIFIRAMEGCRALTFPEPNECSGDYCYHGGTCVKDDFGVLSCVNCPEGFEGPRCQQLRHSFDGSSYALYAPLEQCEDSKTSIEFITQQADGLLLYNGPMSELTTDQPKDFIALELTGGMPTLHIDHGSGYVSLHISGRDNSNNGVITSLADGQWHKLDIQRKGKFVELIVDDCKAAVRSGSNGTEVDTSPCRVTANTPGENSFLNAFTPLQVGGRATRPSYPSSDTVAGRGFTGCVRNLIHNSKYYDLHYKKTQSVPSGANGCPREDEICGNTCGANGMCSASFSTSQITCVCKPGWRGNGCSTATTVRDLKSNSYLQWRLKDNANLPNYMVDIQVMYRTYDQDGILFIVSTQDQSRRVILQLNGGRLRALFNLGNDEKILLLNNTEASNGQWHVVRFTRVMHQATLRLDGGEGRNHYAQLSASDDNVYMTMDSRASLYAGSIVSSSQGARLIDQDLSDTCIQDVRINNNWLPMKQSENSAELLTEYVTEQQVGDGCTRPDSCVPPICPANTVCVPLWGKHECRCAPGYHEREDQCDSDCILKPCFQDVPCQIDNGTVLCTCTAPWYGQFCNYYPSEGSKDLSVGIADGAIAAIVVAIIVAIALLLVAIFLISCYLRKKDDTDDKFMVDDGDFDIRENVMYYDEEGAGEEDQNAYDLTKLPHPVSEPIPTPRGDPGRLVIKPVTNVPPDDKPDVGDVLYHRLDDASNDPDAPPYDTLIAYAEEGNGSDAGSLSSLGSSSSDGSQVYDYLNEWGPKFAKLADMYGAGEEPE